MKTASTFYTTQGVPNMQTPSVVATILSSFTAARAFV